MLPTTTSDSLAFSSRFLEQEVSDRLQILKQLGLSRYADFMLLMPNTDANVACVMRFFAEPSRVKFPDLRGVELAGLTLDGANLIRANLTGAKLNGSSLVKADLIYAQLQDADLRNTDLRGATLNKTSWAGAWVKGCRLGVGVGLTDDQRQDLQERGALLEFWLK
ncbi:pentapeptide repeat-containing protein [Trichocoleus desertorum AS-A10]|uniref:pentapeptide repeat-containing protein n=1 Tax=Trichocoleus desertorum TaxID=1481672 RepID=UPI00329A2FAF